MPATTRRVLGTYRTGLPTPLRPARALGTARLSGARPTGPARPVTFPTTRLVTRVLIALGADLTASPATWAWEDITGFVRQDLGFAQTVGRPDGSTRVNFGRATLKLDNRDGRFTRRNPNSPYYGLLSGNTPIWITVDAGSGVRDRVQMFVNDWPTRWADKSASDCTVTIQCAGALRRLNQSNTTASPMRRAILAAGPVAYWPLEDGSDSTQGASAVSGGSPMVAGGTVGFGAVTDLVGASASPDMTLGQLQGPVSGGSATAWYAEMAIKQDYATIGILRVYAGGSATHAIYRFFPPTAPGGNISVFIGGLDGSAVAVLNAVAPASFTNVWHHYAVSAQQVGTNVVSTLWLDGVAAATSTDAGTLEAVNQVLINQNLDSLFASVAHVAVGDGATPTRAWAAMSGYVGETAVARIIRTCAEKGVPLVCGGSASPVMGAQPVATDLAILREAEAVDQGVLYETAWGLGYQSVAERTNAAVGLALDFDLKQIAEIPEPADDDQRLNNFVTAKRAGGSEATAEQLTGPLRTTAGGPGVYEDSVTVNVQTDTQLADAAGWRRHLGTVDEDRWPSIAIKLTRSPELIDTWTTLPYGARVTAANPPPQMPPDTIDAIIEGFTEAWNPYNWFATLVTSPFSPYRTGTLAADTGDTAETLLILVPDTLTLAADVNTTDVTWSVNSSPIWTVAAESFPRYIWWEGEVVQLTNCTGGSAPQTWTVVRSINAVVKAHLANSSGRIYRPGVLALA